MQSGEQKNIAIIGGGISGCSIGYYLLKKDYKVTIFEKEKKLGGLASAFNLDGNYIDRFYHHLYTKDKDIIALINELGLHHQLLWKKTKTAVYANKKIYDFSSPLSLLFFDQLSFFERLRFGLLVLKARGQKDLSEFDRVSVKQWLLAKVGFNTYQKLWGPLLEGKFAEHAADVPASWLISKFQQRGASRDNAQGERLGYLKGGFALLFERLEEELKKNGAEVRKELAVKSMAKKAEKFQLSLANGATETFDQVVCCLPSEETQTILPIDFDQDYRRQLNSIKYLGVSCLIIKLSNPLSKNYWLNNTDRTIPFLGVIEQTNMLGKEHYGGHHLAYLPRYLNVAHPDFQLDAASVCKKYLPYLKKIFPVFVEDWVKDYFLFKTPYAQPLINLSYKENIPAVKTPVKGLYYLSMAQIYPQDRQLNNSVKMARDLAQSYF